VTRVSACEPRVRQRGKLCTAPCTTLSHAQLLALFQMSGKRFVLLSSFQTLLSQNNKSLCCSPLPTKTHLHWSLYYHPVRGFGAHWHEIKSPSPQQLDFSSSLAPFSVCKIAKRLVHRGLQYPVFFKVEIMHIEACIHMHVLQDCTGCGKCLNHVVICKTIKLHYTATQHHTDHSKEHRADLADVMVCPEKP
jgi:hypothetical protein